MADNFKTISDLDISFKEFMPGQIIQSAQFNDDMRDIEEKVNEVIGEHNKVSNTVVDHFNNKNNPHEVTAHQVGAYTIEEVDGLYNELREGNFNDGVITNRVLGDGCVNNRVIEDGTITASKVEDGFGHQIDISENIEITDRYTKNEVDDLVRSKVGEGTYTKEEIDEKFQNFQAGQIIDKTISADKVTSDFGDNIDISNNTSITNRYTKGEVDMLISMNGLPRDWGNITEQVDVDTGTGSLPVAGHMVAGQFTSPAISVLDVEIKEVVEARGEYNSVGERLDGVDSQIKNIETRIDNIGESGGSSGNVDLSGYVTKEVGNASQITFADGQTFQAKLDTGTLKGDKGEPGINGADGQNGATFTPSVDAEGNLSWTNDKGLENPPTVNIKGEKGDSGTGNSGANIDDTTASTTTTYSSNKIETIKEGLSSRITTIENDGVSQQVIENKVQSVIDEKIADGSIGSVSYKLDRTLNLFELEGAKVYNYYKEEKCIRYTDVIYNNQGVQSTLPSGKVIKIPVKSNATYCVEGFGSPIVYTFNIEDLNEKFIKNLTVTKENDIYTMEISGVTDSAVYLVVSYKGYPGNIKVYESGKLFDSNEYKVELDDLIATKLSETGKNEIISSISEKIVPLPITRDYLNTTTDNYLNKNEIVYDKIYNNNNTETADANRNYVKVKLIPGKTYVDNFYNSTRYLFDKHMNYMSTGINNITYNSSYKTAKYTISNSDDYYCYLIINFQDSYMNNPFVVEVEDDSLEVKYDYAEFTHRFDIISSGVINHSIDELSLKPKMSPYVLDGIGCTNYWDAQYNIDNLLKNEGKYVQSAINYLPPGTYTINDCYSVTLISTNGKPNTIAVGNKPCTFEITEDYCRYTAYIKVDGNVEKLRNIIVQKGTTTDGVKDRKYTFDNFKVKNIGYYPTHWENKKYVAIGDSITRGYAPANSSLNIAEGSQIELPYAKYTAQQLGLEFQNLGEDGATVSSVIGYNVFNKIKGTPDIISIYLGANDMSKLSLGTIDDVYTEGAETCTYYGGLKYIVKKLKETYPLAMIILIGNTYTTTRVSSKVDEYNNAKKEIADLYNVLYLDMARETGFDLSFESMVTELQLNSIHPNYKAHEIMGSRLTGFIASH